MFAIPGTISLMLLTEITQMCYIIYSGGYITTQSFSNRYPNLGKDITLYISLSLITSCVICNFVAFNQLKKGGKEVENTVIRNEELTKRENQKLAKQFVWR